MIGSKRDSPSAINSYIQRAIARQNGKKVPNSEQISATRLSTGNETDQLTIP